MLGSTSRGAAAGGGRRRVALVTLVVAAALLLMVGNAVLLLRGLLDVTAADEDPAAARNRVQIVRAPGRAEREGMQDEVMQEEEEDEDSDNDDDRAALAAARPVPLLGIVVAAVAPWNDTDQLHALLEQLVQALAAAPVDGAAELDRLLAAAGLATRTRPRYPWSRPRVLVVSDDVATCDVVTETYPVRAVCVARGTSTLRAFNLAAASVRADRLLLLVPAVTLATPASGHLRVADSMRVLASVDADIVAPLLLEPPDRTVNSARVLSAGVELFVAPARGAPGTVATNAVEAVHRLEGVRLQSPEARVWAKVAGAWPGAVFVRRSAFVQVGGFDSDIGDLTLAAVDLALRMRREHTDARSAPPALFAPDLAFYVAAGALTYRTAMTDEMDARWQRRLQPALTKYLSAFLWDGYLNDCTGWASEAISFVTNLERMLDFLAIVGDSSFCPGYSTSVERSLHRMRQLAMPAELDVWVSHKPPKSYPVFPYKGLRHVERRPPVVVGRSMIESVVAPDGWARRNVVQLDRANRVDEIWVPSSFLLDVFIAGGVPREKLWLLPEAVDMNLFERDSTEPWPLTNQRGFRFLSIFKWEERKGWDVLLKAYVQQFTIQDDVCLVLHTYVFRSEAPREVSSVWKLINAFLEREGLAGPDVPCIEVLTKQMDKADMPRLYKAADAFVLPTRGEGWGLPLLEAMAMGLPAIATNFSGHLDFMLPHLSHLIEVDAIVAPKDRSLYDPSIRWAEPSVEHLRSLMLDVFQNRQRARTKAADALRHVRDMYNEPRIARLAAERLHYLVTEERRRAAVV